MKELMHIISLGAGVQSSTMALMAAAGEIGPMPEAAIFADTQAEPASVYKWLDWLEKQLPFPVYRVTKGSLRENALTVKTSKFGNRYTNGGIPAFVVNNNGKVGMLQRQCTQNFKIRAIAKEIRRLRTDKRLVVQWIGISTDEAQRMKPAHVKYIENRWPLIEKNFSRNDCIAWMQSKDFPEPPRSSCVFCPYHNNDEWQRLKMDEPAAFADAVQFEIEYQAALAETTMKGTPFLHKSCRPLSEIDFTPADEVSAFGNECEGVCGV